MLAIVNVTAGGGQAAQRWERVCPALLARLPGIRILNGDHGVDGVRRAIGAALASGETRFVAAGGDGTVNLLAATLADLAGASLDRLTLGAVALGSSNDFHKPYHPATDLAGRPARLDFARATPRDVCAVRWTDEAGASETGYYIVNASIGITAEANWRFNHPGPVLRALKPVSTGAAITWAALTTIAHCPPLDATLTLDDGAAQRVRLKNLGVVKCPNFAGSLRYDSPFEPDSGRLDVHLVRAMPLHKLLRVFARLGHGQFRGIPGTASWQAQRVAVRANRPFAVEMDGEVVRAVSAEFFVLPHKLKVCP